MTGPIAINPVLDALLKMREYLSDEDHWLKGRASDGAGRVCVIGATTLFTDDHSFMPVVDHLDKIVGKLGYPTVHDQLCATAEFNDAADTLHADVVSFLDLAVDELIHG